MKFDLSTVRFSKNDIKYHLKVPKELDSDLAYLLGIQVGDGYLKKQQRGTTIDYSISYDGHKINDTEWYLLVLKKLIKNLFNKDVQVFSTDTGTVRIMFRSKLIFTFLNKVCHISESPKTNIRIPDFIFNSDQRIKSSFLRGLADTDFSLTFKKRQKKHHYPVIYFQTNSESLHRDTKELLLSLGFNVTGGYRISKRYAFSYDSYYIQISGRYQLEKWIKEIGFTSFNHLTRYDVWKMLGYLPVGTDIIERRNILKRIKGPKWPPTRPRGDSNS